MPSYAELLTTAKSAYSDILNGRTEEFRALNYQQRMLRLKDLGDEIERLELLAGRESGGCAIRPIRSVRI